MVKVQKPNPKSIKKNNPGKLKEKDNIKKRPLEKLLKSKVKAAEKPLEIVSKNIAKDVKKKNNSLIKKQNATKKAKKIIASKKPVSKKQEAFQNNVQKKTPLVAVLQKEAQTNGYRKHKKEVETEDKTKETPYQNLGIETKNVDYSICELDNFDEERFRNILSLSNIKKICESLKSLVQKEVSVKKTSIFTDYRYILNISSYKIPSCPKRMSKLNLKHSLVDIYKDDIVMIVPDLQRGAKVDYEPTIQHYEDLFRNIGEYNIKIVPFNQLRNEVTTYEAKKKFSNSYDYFLCDGRIVGQVVGHLGSFFQKARTTIHAVRLDKPQTYKKNLERSLTRTSYRQLCKGDLISIPVGNHLFTIDQLSENVEEVIRQLKTIYPGGYPNIRKIYIKIDIKGTSSFLLYMNFREAPTEVPNVIGPREERMLKLKRQANDILTKFSLSKTGDILKLNKAQEIQKRKLKRKRTLLLSKESNHKDNSTMQKRGKKTKHYVRPNATQNGD